VTTSGQLLEHLTSPENSEVIGQFKKFRSSTLRERAKTRPPLPTSLDLMDLNDDNWKTTLDKRSVWHCQEGY